MSLKTLEFLNEVSTNINKKAIEMMNKGENPYYRGVATTSKFMSDVIEHEISLEKGNTNPPESIDKIISNMINKGAK